MNVIKKEWGMVIFAFSSWQKDMKEYPHRDRIEMSAFYFFTPQQYKTSKQANRLNNQIFPLFS